MKQYRNCLLLILMVVLSFSLQAQNDSVMVSRHAKVAEVSSDDSVKVSHHTPTKAMLLSIIPGGGQIYNHKAWKVPIFYAALAGCGYFIYDYASQMVAYKQEFINRRDGNIELLNSTMANVNDENLIHQKNKFLRNMELAIGAAAVVYMLNIIDAMVDAHLYYFDISDDLSIQWSPMFNMNMASSKPVYGLSLQFNFGK